MKILTIDDNGDNLIALTAMLRTYLPGCVVATARSGREGIESARTFLPDTILLDIQMPEMDGFEVCQVLKGDLATKSIPVIFLTALKTDSALRIRGLEIGGDAFLTKPVEPGELMAQVRAMVRLKVAEDALRADKRSLELIVAERTLELRESLERFAQLAERSRTIIWEVNSGGLYTYVGPMAEAVWGYRPEELVGQLHFYDLHPVEGRDAFKTATLASFARKVSFRDIEFPVRAKNGRLVWMVTCGIPLLDEGGMLRGYRGSGADATERRRAQEALRASETKFRDLFANALNGVALHEIVLDYQGTPVDYIFLEANPAFEKHTGARVADILGKSATQVFPGIEKTKLIATFGKVALTGAPAVFELFFEPLQRHYDMGVYSVGRGCFAVVFADISARKLAEAERAKLEIQNWQLQKSESLGRMAGAIAHHFNNRLQAVMLGLQMASFNLSSQARPVEGLAEAMAAAGKAAELSNLMLTYLGETHDDHAPMDLSKICQDSLTLLHAAMPEGTILEADLPAPGPGISGNANQIQQVVTSLVTNAWEAGGDRPGTIRISVRSFPSTAIPPAIRFPVGWQPQTTDYACLEVADAGCGIPAKDINKLFEPFFSSKLEGRGLGLAAILGIARSHHGVVTVESAPQRGSVFRVFFPLAASGNGKPSGPAK